MRENRREKKENESPSKPGYSRTQDQNKKKARIVSTIHFRKKPSSQAKLEADKSEACCGWRFH
jgi:hypothetical protein